MFRVVRDNSTTTSDVETSLSLNDARELAELHASEHAERIDVSYWQVGFSSDAFRFITNNGTTVTYKVEKDETK